MTHELALKGCAPAPLAFYLKALGILRLIAEQADPQATGAWQGECFNLRSKLDPLQLEQFFLKDFRPSPIIAPWNGGSGFYYQEGKLNEKDADSGKKKKTGVRNQPTKATQTVDNMLASQAERLSDYRALLGLAKTIVGELGYEEAPKEEKKQNFIQRIRARLPEHALPVIDAGVILSTEKLGFPPLLGTGWNDGNFDFSNNFMQRVLSLFDTKTGEPAPTAPPQLRGALFDEPLNGLESGSIGQFFPGSGGPNSGSGFEGKSLVNSWDFVLMLEGVLLFAAAVTRRLESSAPSALAYPFTVRVTAAGSGAAALADEKSSRAEIWLPLWNRFAGISEIKALFSEGRATVGRRTAINTLDFARAIAALGIDRGLSEFQRYGFLQRSGKAFLAVPLTRITVTRNPQADLINTLDQNKWLKNIREFIRQDNTPGNIRQLVRRLEAELFSLTRQRQPQTVQEIIALLGEIQQVCAVSAKSREKIQPLPLLPEDWAVAADDGSAEFRLAFALASIHTAGFPMRYHCFAINANKGFDQWKPGSSLTVYGSGSLTDFLNRVALNRLLHTLKQKLDDKLFDSFAFTELQNLSAFLQGETDDTRILRLLTGLSCIKTSAALPKLNRAAYIPPAAYRILKPFFIPRQILHKLELLKPGTCLPLPLEVLQWLKSGDAELAERAVFFGWRHLKFAGLNIPDYPGQAPAIAGINTARLLAALTIPLSYPAIFNICRNLKPETI